ncbi:MAG: hypothetical protein SFH39_07350 [Candidatus Magnetobacterium sp. LHC-1]
MAEVIELCRDLKIEAAATGPEGLRLYKRKEQRHLPSVILS